MRHLELHIIQSVPVACLNRDDLNSPKTAIFGGVQRARVSSQSWKRAIREMADKDIDKSNQFKGKRSRLFIEKIRSELQKLDEKDEIANALAVCAGHYLAKLDAKQEGKVKTLVFLSPIEYALFASLLHSLDAENKQKLVDAFSNVDKAKLAKDEDNDEEGDEEELDVAKPKKGEKKLSVKQFGKLVAKILSQPIKKTFKDTSLPKDAADIALFGRMVANDHSLTVEAASMFSHALSTHKVDNEIDFFSAVDDLQPKDESGAGMTSTLEFNSATYYRFAGLNLDMLADDGHLGSMSKDERVAVVRTFIEATIKAIPSARKNTMNGNTLPNYVLGIVRENGHPIQLVNAFEHPIRSTLGYTEKSIELLKSEYAKVKETWGISAKFEKAVPEIGLNELINGMVAHVI
jgi:CRISPR system Cascade subunit CasC